MKSKKSKIKESPLFWPAEMRGSALYVLDETLIPDKVHYIKVSTAREAVKVIRDMKTRAFGQFLVVLSTFLLDLNNKKYSDKQLVNRIKTTARMLNASRPTFPFAEVTSIVVQWADIAVKQNKDIHEFVGKNIQGYLMGIRMRRLGRVENIAKILKNNDSVLTHCNVSGELAMAAALCQQQKKKVKFFATETRPYFQGAKLTVWELDLMGADVTLIADNAVGAVMNDGMVNKVIVGSDRNCANGDFANKIGTYQIAILAKEFKIPVYVLTQPSKKIKKGSDMPIEFRDGDELLKYKGKRTMPKGVKGLYPGFDIIPHTLVTQTIPIEAGA